MDPISLLRTTILTNLRGTPSGHSERELFDQLTINKSRLLNLFNVGPRNGKEQQGIESGKATLGGRQLAINADFARQVIFLSTNLDCSEYYVASVLHDVVSRNPNINPELGIETAINSFHQTRRYLADCLRYLLEAAEVKTQEPSVYSRIADFVYEDLVPGTDGVTLASRIFREIEATEALLTKALAARQSARSTTTLTSNQQATLGYDVLNARVESLKYERRILSIALCSLARSGHFLTNDIKPVVEWLSTNPYHPLTYFLLTSLFSIFDPSDPDSESGALRKTLADDRSLIQYMSRKLDTTSEWKDMGLKAVILLKWALFLTDIRRRDNSLENREGFRTEELEAHIWNAVQSGSFTYLILAVYHLQGKRTSSSFPSLSLSHHLSLSPEQESMRELPPPDFKITVLDSFEILLRSLLTHASSELRKIKQRQEDLVLAKSRARAPKSSSAQPRNDVGMLYSFIGLLFHALPEERALQFWGSMPSQDNALSSQYQLYEESQTGKLPGFLQWAVWSTQPNDTDMTMALYDMLSGLAKGQHCSELAYNFMARGGAEVITGSSGQSSSGSSTTLSWATIFNMLEHWATQSTSPRQQLHHGQGSSGFGFSTSQATQHGPQQLMIGPSEVLLAQSCLRLLSSVVSHSVAVRVAISGNTHFKAIPTLVSLIPLGVPLELKGSLFDTLAAFCQPGAGVAGVDICKAVWSLMERLEVINVRAGSGNGSVTPGFGSLRQVKGVEVELEDVESVHKLYPATIPFLNLLANLIHTPKCIPLRETITESEPVCTVPENLGSPYRLPGIGPFVDFVIDNVFGKIATREYAKPSDRWEMNDLCLCFIERSLASFDLEGLIATAERQKLREEQLLPLLIHPGYDIMKRLLTNTPVQNTILSYIVDGIEGFEKEFDVEEPFFKSTIVRVLRIVHRVLQIQDIFLDVLLPLMSEFRECVSIVGTLYPRSYFTSFDQVLSYNPRTIPSLSAYVTFLSHTELSLLSVKIIAQLSTSGSFSNLTAMIEQSDESDRIINGFRQILSVDSWEDVKTSEMVADQVTGAGASDAEVASEPLEQALRLAVLDFFIASTHSGKSYPNLAHYLLFGGTSITQIQDPHALGSQQTCIHVILDLLNAGVPRLRNKSREEATHATPLFEILPELAERCYHLVYQLCVHPRTSDFTMRYLRTREDFFARQIATVPSQVPGALAEAGVEVQYHDGSRTLTTIPALTSFLRLRSWVFDLVALELHVLTSKGMHRSATHLLEILFGHETTTHQEQQQLMLLGWEDDNMTPFREVGQSHMRIIEFVQSLNFDWADSLAVDHVDLQLLGGLDLLSCVRADTSGCQVVDKDALLALLNDAKRRLHAQGVVATAGHADQLNKEIKYILQSCAVENHRREVRHAMTINYDSWRRVLDVTLMKCFSRLPHSRRENMLFDLLHVLPSTIRLPDIEDSTAVLLSEATLSCITKLREDRHYQVVMQSAGGDADAGGLPAERLHAILRSILECILEKNKVELVRGNLYATLISYLHLISSPENAPSVSIPSDSSVPRALSLSTTLRDDLLASSNRASPSPLGQASGTLVSGSLALIKAAAERLILTISRDAMDGAEVWKTIAFMLLDALVQVSRTEKHHVALVALARQGILANFVREIRESDQRLQSVLKPDPDDLNPLYVYEAKMSLLIRIAQTRIGAERLLESNILGILGQCDFIDARPEADQSFMDNDSFLPSAIQRYHQLLMPALQLINSLRATLGPKHTTVANQIIEFLSSHRDTFVIFLKTEIEDATLSMMEEVHLLINLCGSVLHCVPKIELTSSNSDFGSIHAAILATSARYLASGKWGKPLIPITDSEMANASTPASGRGSVSKFEVQTRCKERILHKAFVSYIGSASEFTEPEISVVLSPNTNVVRSGFEDRGSSRYLASLPSIGDTIEALNNVFADCSSNLRLISDLSAELSSKNHVRVDNIEEIMSDLDAEFLQDLDIGQKRSLVCRALIRVREEVREEAKVLLGTAEMLLLLLWRHLSHYMEDQADHTPAVQQSGSLSASRLRSSMISALASSTYNAKVPEEFKSEVGNRISAILSRLVSINESDFDSLGDEHRSSKAYIEIMVRRLRDCVGLHAPEDGSRPGGQLMIGNGESGSEDAF